MCVCMCVCVCLCVCVCGLRVFVGAHICKYVSAQWDVRIYDGYNTHARRDEQILSYAFT